jgi:pimeloyl-ACP methyl ester carboxylesterase
VRIFDEIARIMSRRDELLTEKGKRVLTESEAGELASLDRSLALRRTSLLFLMVGTLLAFGAFAVLLTANFAQLFAVPGNTNEEVSSGVVHESLLRVTAQCAPKKKPPALYVVPTVDTGFSTVASGIDMMHLTVGKVAVAKPFVERLSPTALDAIFGHEIGYLHGKSNDGFEADLFSAQCLGKPAVLRALHETETILTSAEFVELLRSSGATEEDLGAFVASVREAVAERRLFLNAVLQQGALTPEQYELSPRTISVLGQFVHVEVRGVGSPIILLHGFASSTYTWRFVIDELAKKHRVIALDLFGFGASARPEGKEWYSIPRQGDLVLGVIEQLQLSDVTLVGHSYGAFVALDVAGASPRVNKLVLVSGGYGDENLAPSLLRVALLQALARPARDLLQYEWAWRMGLASAFGPDHPPSAEISAMYQERFLSPWFQNAYHGLVANLPGVFRDRTRAVRERGVSTIVVWGANDSVFPVEQSLLLAKRLGAQTSIISGGHMVPEEHPKVLAGIVHAHIIQK